MAENLVFITGPQGGGKTTLVNLLRGPVILIPELKTKTISLNTEPTLRLSLKICQRALENFEYLTIAQTNPNKTVIGNRCIYDQDAFNEVYVRRGWFPREKKEHYNAVARMFYPQELHNPRAIVLNPGFEVVWRHLNQRWQTEEKKWNEDDQEYIRIACEVYEPPRDNPRVLYIDHEIDLTTDQDIKAVRRWLTPSVQTQNQNDFLSHNPMNELVFERESMRLA